MEINKTVDGTKMTLAVAGRLDTVTSPDLQQAVEQMPADVTDICFDFAKLDYISSAGLRVLLAANKKMLAAGGRMAIAGANPIVKDVFDMTGFSDILTLV